MDARFVLARPLSGHGHQAAARTWGSFTNSDHLLAPPLLWAECASVLRESAYRNTISAESSHQTMAHVLTLPIAPIHSPTIYARAIALAERLGWAKAYDALYLATAEHQAAELLTVDRGMRDAAVRLGIQATLVS